MDATETVTDESWLPLSGHILFASIRWKQIDEVELQKSIHRLGGKLETFFSHEITCVLTDELSYPVRRDKTLKRNQNGKLLNEIPRYSRIVDKAKSLGIEVMRIDTFLTWLKPHGNVRLKTQDVKRLNKLNKTTKLNGCFMKIESICKNYSPIYKVYSNPPDVEFEELYYKSCEDAVSASSSSSSRSKSTFSVNIKLPEFLNIGENRIDQEGKSKKPLPSLSSSEPVKNNNVKAKRHYCECCKMYFSCLENHLRGPQHLKYVSNDEHFSQLTALISGMNSITNLKAKQSEKFDKDTIISEQLNTNSDVKTESSVEYENELKEFLQCNDNVSSDNLNEILKFEDLRSSDLKKNTSERIFPSLCEHDIDEVNGNGLATENALLKDVNFSDIISTGFLPENDRLFSSDVSDNESIQQDVLNVIKCFDEEASVDNSVLLSNTGSDSLVSKFNVSTNSVGKDLLGRTKENPCISKYTNQILTNCRLDSWTIRPVSEIKMVFVRCSVSPEIQKLGNKNTNSFPCNAWIVKDLKDTKLVLTRSKFNDVYVET